MTTITLDKPTHIKKTHFTDMDQLIEYIAQEYLHIDFKELDSSEVTDEMRKSIDEAKKIPKHLLHNI